MQKRRGSYMKTSFLRWAIGRGEFDGRFSELYGNESAAGQKSRYISALDRFSIKYGDGKLDNDVHVFSVPGRSEICGNHTDHNCGAVIGCAVDIDLILVASPIEDRKINIMSEGFGFISLDIDQIMKTPPEKFTTKALVAGVCAGFMNRGCNVGGFNAYITSNVKRGSGLSSSAAFEAAVGTVLNFYYNENKLDSVEIAKISQYAEREYFGKACGLMDQAICSVGGLVMIDFENETAPKIEKLDIDFSEFGISMCITDTGGDHSDLSDDYSSIPTEMKKVAEHFGQRVLRFVDSAALIEEIPKLRSETGDRAILRALHFADENIRVARLKTAMLKHDAAEFLRIISESGESSERLLQNIYSPKQTKRQGIALALEMSARLLKGKNAAWRVHGGGFAGTVQAFVPNELVEEFRSGMERVFGEGSCTVMQVRSSGAVTVF